MTLSLLHRTSVLVLNRNWQAIRTITPAEAFRDLAIGAARALLIEGGSEVYPLDWQAWLARPVTENQPSIGTPRGRVRIPSVIVLNHYNRIPLVRPGFNLRGLWERDQGRCQYTGRRLIPSEASIDHILPRSRGGANHWTNCVLADRRINHRKGARTPQEAGLQLIRQPRIPRAIPATLRIRNLYQIPDWNLFLPEHSTPTPIFP